MAFALDAWGTYIMWRMDLPLSGWVPIVHTSLTLTAIALFFVQGAMGARVLFGGSGRRRWRLRHAFFAKWVFLPAWALSFFSGFLFAL